MSVFSYPTKKLKTTTLVDTLLIRLENPSSPQEYKTTLEALKEYLAATFIIKSVTITLTDAQIKALPTTYIELVPALGEGKIIQFVSATIVTNIMLLNAYTNISSDALFMIVYGDWMKEASSICPLFNAMANSSFAVLSPLTLDHTITGWTNYPESILDSIENSENLPIKLIANNTGGNFTGGNVANTLKIKVYYLEVDL